MLPRRHRLLRADDFRSVSRSRARGRSALLTVTAAPAHSHTRIGMVVPRAVGTAVVRNRVRRRLRHLCRGYLDLVPPKDLVIRAHPSAGRAGYAELQLDLETAVQAATGRSVR